MKDVYDRRTTIVLLGVLCASGLTGHITHALAQDAQPTQMAAAQAASAPAQGTPAAQPKVSPYATVNLQRLQSNAAATRSPSPAAPHAARKGTTSKSKRT